MIYQQRQPNKRSVPSQSGWCQPSSHRRHITIILLFLLLLLSVAACTDDQEYAQAVNADAALPMEEQAPAGDPISDVTIESAAGYPIELYDEACPIEVSDPERVACAILTVPEDRSIVDGPTVDIAVAFIASASSDPQPDPVIYLEGGPGGGTLISLDEWLESPILADRDLILFDQRGTGYSWPSLDCPETDAFDAGESPEGVLQIEAVEQCRARLVEQGVDLTAYNSAASAADVNDLRQVLGIDEWNLFGISYGTRLGLTILRDYPEGVRSAVLDSVYPPNVDAYTVQAQVEAEALLALLDGCAEDIDCNGWYPDLKERFLTTLDDLNTNPQEVDGASFLGDDLVSTLIGALYDTTQIPLLPYVIDEATFGNLDPLFELGNEESAQGAPTERSPLLALAPAVTWRSAHLQDQDEADMSGLDDSQGLYYSVECHEEVPFGDLDAATDLMDAYPEQIAVPLLATLGELYNACSIWGADEADAVESEPVYSEVPTLLLTGEYDPATPPAWARLAAETLPNHVYVEVPRGGHSVTSDGDCPSQIMVDFFNDPMTEPDSSCILEPLPFE